MIPLFAYLYNRGQSKEKKYSIIDIFPYFVIGFVAMIIIRNVGDQLFILDNSELWLSTVDAIKSLSKKFCISKLSGDIITSLFQSSGLKHHADHLQLD